MFTSPKTIEDYILHYLKTGSLLNIEIIQKLQIDRPGTTKQGVYIALRDLKRQEVILTQGKKSALNIRWLKSLEDYFSIARRSYVQDGTDGHPLYLKEGEKIQYLFYNSEEADSFWWHILYLLAESSQTGQPVYLYNPHDWFLIARRQSELESLRSIVKMDKQYLMTVGGNTVLDKYIAKDFDSTNSQYYMADKPMFKKNNYYLNIVDDFLIEVHINPSIANEVEKFYASVNKINEVVLKDLHNIVRAHGKIRLVVSRNYAKAKELKNLLQKHFYLVKTTAWFFVNFAV